MKCFQRRTGFSLVLTSALSTYLKNLHQNEGHPPGNAQNLQICTYGERKQLHTVCSFHPSDGTSPVPPPFHFPVPLRAVIYQHHRLECLLWETSTRDPSWEEERHVQYQHKPWAYGCGDGALPWGALYREQGHEVWAVTRCPDGNNLSTPSEAVLYSDLM